MLVKFFICRKLYMLYNVFMDNKTFTVCFYLVFQLLTNLNLYAEGGNRLTNSGLVFISADESEKHGLPRAEVSLNTEGLGMSGSKFSHKTEYFKISGPPGGPLGISLNLHSNYDLNESAAAFADKLYPERKLEYGSFEEVSINDGVYKALTFTSGEGFSRAHHLAVIFPVPESDEVLLLDFYFDGRGTSDTPSPSTVLADRYSKFLTSFSLNFPQKPASSKSMLNHLLVMSDNDSSLLAVIIFRRDPPYISLLKYGEEANKLKSVWDEIVKHETLEWKHGIEVDKDGGTEYRIIGEQLSPTDENYYFAVQDYLSKAGYASKAKLALLFKVEKGLSPLGYISFPYGGEPLVYPAVNEHNAANLIEIWEEISKLDSLPLDGERHTQGKREYYTQIVKKNDKDYPYAIWDYLEKHYNCRVSKIM